MMTNIKWHRDINDHPRPDVPCFVIGEGLFTDQKYSLAVACYDADKDVWYDDVFGGQRINPYITQWAYVPQEILYVIGSSTDNE